MEAKSKFQVYVSGYHSSVEEWQRALTASNLPDLTDQEKEIAKRFGVSEDEYKRGKLAGQYGRERLESKARKLGEQVQNMLSVLGEEYRLVAVLWEGARLRWLLRIQTREKVVGVPVSLELADDVVDSAILQEIEKLKRVVLSGVGREDLLVDAPSK